MSAIKVANRYIDMNYNFKQHPATRNNAYTGVRVYKNQMRISSAFNKMMNNPEYINIYTDIKNKVIAIEPCKEDAEHCRKIYANRVVNCRLEDDIINTKYFFKHKQNELYICTIKTI